MRKSCISPIAISLVVLVLLAAGCKEGDPISGTISPASASFVEESPPAGVTDHVVEFKTSTVDGGRITLDVVITEINEPITGVAMKLTYPDAFSKFVSCTDGSLFPAGPCYFDEPESGSGEVFIGRTVTGVAQATEVNGSQVVVRLEFLVFGNGEGMIRIEGQNLGGGDASAVLDVNGDPVFVQWYSGMLRGM
jgi:hypothetical protein